MPAHCLEQLPIALMGVALGVTGFLPLLAAVFWAHRRHATPLHPESTQATEAQPDNQARTKPSIAKGLVAILLSFTFLMAVEAAIWVLRPEWLLAAFAGMLLGFFAAWTLLAFWAVRHRK